MSFLDSLLTGLGTQASEQTGTEAAGGLTDLIQSQGGLGGLVTKFGQNDLSDLAASWIGSGPNQAITSDQIHSVLGSGPIEDFATRLGVSPSQASQFLAQVLPHLIDRLTPAGRLPQDSDPLEGLLGRLPGGLTDGLGGLFKR